jgi:hypothetical protein
VTNPGHPLTETVVTNYLKEKIMTLENNSMFVHVCPPIEGVHKVLVKLEHFMLVMNYLKSVHGELAKPVHEQAVCQVFSDSDKVIMDCNKPDWEMYTRLWTIECKTSTKKFYNNK